MTTLRGEVITHQRMLPEQLVIRDVSHQLYTVENFLASYIKNQVLERITFYGGIDEERTKRWKSKFETAEC